MNKYLEVVGDKIKTNKRKLIKRASILVAIIAGLGVAGFTTVYGIAKSNINYTVEEARAIVLQSVQGEILRVNKILDLDTFIYSWTNMFIPCMLTILVIILSLFFKIALLCHLICCLLAKPPLPLSILLASGIGIPSI